MGDKSTIVQRLWNYCNVLRDDGVSYGDYAEQGVLFLQRMIIFQNTFLWI